MSVLPKSETGCFSSKTKGSETKQIAICWKDTIIGSETGMDDPQNYFQLYVILHANYSSYHIYRIRKTLVL